MTLSRAVLGFFLALVPAGVILARCILQSTVLGSGARGDGAHEQGERGGGPHDLEGCFGRCAWSCVSIAVDVFYVPGTFPAFVPGTFPAEND